MAGCVKPENGKADTPSAGFCNEFKRTALGYGTSTFGGHLRGMAAAGR